MSICETEIIKEEFLEEDDDDDCAIVTVERYKVAPPVSVKLQDEVKIRPESSDDDDDDVQLIKVERIKQPNDVKNNFQRIPERIIKRLQELKAESEKNVVPLEPLGDPLNVSKYFPCTLCKRIFATAIDLVQHSAHHEKKKKKAKRAPGSGSGEYECQVCQIRFEKQVSLAAHMNVHRDRPGAKQFKCRTCNEMFKSNGSLWNHRKSKHMEKVYRCGTCCKTFALETSYNDHMKRHEDEGIIQCQVCDKSKSY